MATIKTRRGKYHYRPVTLFLGINQINKEVAFQNLKDIAEVLEKHRIPLAPCFGTLLGIIRDHDFIDWDEDIDLMVLGEQKEELLDAFWDMREIGFEFIRHERCYHTLSVMRNGEYIDFNVMDSISPEIRTDYGGGFFFEKHLTQLIEWDFKGLTVLIPKDYEEYLDFMYGDWRTPVRYIQPDMSPWLKRKRKLMHKLKLLLPLPLRFYLTKRHHTKDLLKFQKKCETKGVKLNYPIKWL